MKLIAFSTLLAAVLLTGTAFAGIPELPGLHHQAAVVTTPSPVRTPQTKQLSRIKLPPVKLPNITALTRALVREPDRSKLAAQRVSSARVLKFWEGRGKWLRAPNKEKCWQVPWQRSCTVARASWRLHFSLHTVANHRLQHELPVANDWRAGIMVAQRAYPGTSSWLWSCSDAEGGHGRWVWYGGRTWNGYHIGDDFLGMDTVGGWMQFRYSTFAPYWRQTQANLRSRGFEIPYLGDGEYAAWLSPLAQALTAGYMRYYGKDGHHWSASHGNGC